MPIVLNGHGAAVTLPVARGKDGKLMLKNCRLKPGKNDVPAELLDALRNHKLVQNWFATGILTLVGDEPAPAPRPAQPDTEPAPPMPEDNEPEGLPANLRGYTIAEAEPYIAACQDIALLDSWMEDGRAGIQSRISARIAELEE